MALSLEKLTDPVALADAALPLLINVIAALLIFFIGKWVVARIVDLMKKALRRRNVDETLSNFIGNIAFALGVAVVVISALGRIGVDTTSAAAVLGGAALAVGLALQGQLSSFAAGVMLILFRPFQKGHFVEVAGKMGTVEEITIVATRLASTDNQELTIPNAQVWSNVITNYSAKPTRRVDLLVNIAYSADLRRAKDILMGIMQEESRLLAEPAPSVLVTNLGDNAVDLAVRGYCNTSEWWATRCDLIERIKLALDDEGIEIPFPQMDLHVRDMAPAANA
ncbi:mechanosensitive ion channel family protein [Algiphilus sp.]|uniref:mechanosensitive ion channel family protein n=1 Tax=Algiphilus sp. TaxID=1872431 RepID=UPI003B5300E3